jgi:hypothetical protein
VLNYQLAYHYINISLHEIIEYMGTPITKIQKDSLPRDLRLDALRGLMLLLIVFHHHPLIKGWILDESFGYVNVLEGFIFLSGYIAGLIYSQKLILEGRDEMIRQALRRSATIYLFHIITFVAAFAILHTSNLTFETWTPLIDRDPVTSLLAIVTLLFQPVFLDILPMFFVFALCAPWIIIQFRKRRGWSVIGISLGIWLLAQLGMRNWITNQCSKFFIVNFGFFDMFAYQLLFVTGLALGVRRYDKGKTIAPLKSRNVAFIGCLALILFTFRYQMLPLSNFVNTNWLIDKSELGPLRLLNFSLIAILISDPELWPEESFWVRGLAYLGRYSLQVFSYCIVLDYASGLTLGRHTDTARIILGLLCPLSLYLPAWICEQLRLKKQQMSRAMSR